MFVKNGDCKTIADVVFQNTGIPREDFLAENNEPYIKNLDEAVNLTLGYLKDNPNGKITIVGDYDSDGVNATSIMYWGFAKANANVTLRVPHRFSEGYGLSEKIIDEIDSGLLITVDNGIAAIDAIKKAKEKGLLVVVTDHHMPVINENGNMVLPEADVIVDPQVEDESEFKNYCGAAIAYRFVCKMHQTKFDSLLVLASIATVTDVMPLVGANRTIVKSGLEVINRRKNVPGLNALLDTLRLGNHINEGDYGFKIGPIFNAPGRIYDNGAEYVVKLLCSKRADVTNPAKAESLIRANERRKELVNRCLAMVQGKITDEDRPIVFYNKGIPEGIVGLIAGRLCEEYHCPAIVFTDSEEPGVLKGSGRSIPEIHLKNILDKIQSEILRYGGHAGAAGLSISKENLDRFTDAFKKATGPVPDKPKDVLYDLDLDLGRLDEIGEELTTFAPYGEGNPQIVFRGRFTVPPYAYRRIGDGSHFLMKPEGITLMGFGLADRYEEMGSPETFDAVGYLSESWFRDEKSWQFEVIDISVG